MIYLFQRNTFLAAIRKPNRRPRRGGRFTGAQAQPNKRLFTHGTNALNGESKRTE